MLTVVSIGAVLLVGGATEATPVVSAPQAFVIGPDFTMESGVRSISALSEVFFLYDGALSRSLDWSEETALGKTLGVVGRLTKLAFIDAPLAAFMQTVIHEVYGHGARGREAGLNPTFDLRVPKPYGWILGDTDDFVGITNDAATGKLERDTPMVVGGIESDYWTAHWLSRSMIQNDGWMHYGTLLSYGIAKFSYVPGFLDLGIADNGSNDVENYIRHLGQRFNRWRPGGRAKLGDALRRGYVWNYIDPVFWLAAYHGLVTYVFFGDKHAQLPLIRIGPLKMLPTTRFNLTPFGAEHYIDFLGALDDLFSFDLYARAGSSGLARYWGLGLGVFGFSPGFGISLGAEVDLWDQPEILFNHRNVFDRENRVGAAGALHAEWQICGRFGLVGKLAYKAKGHLMGQPVKKGWYGYAGVSMYPTADKAAFSGCW